MVKGTALTIELQPQQAELSPRLQERLQKPSSVRALNIQDLKAKLDAAEERREAQLSARKHIPAHASDVKEAKEAREKQEATLLRSNSDKRLKQADERRRRLQEMKNYRVSATNKLTEISAVNAQDSKALQAALLEEKIEREQLEAEIRREQMLLERQQIAGETFQQAIEKGEDVKLERQMSARSLREKIEKDLAAAEERREVLHKRTPSSPSQSAAK